jgi:3-methylcrotonyl-CoA carboxylase alpha subunit
MPAEGDGLRIDTGFGKGDKVSQYYDPMLAKVISCAQTREAALGRLRLALSEIEIAGVATNAAFLVRLLGEEPVKTNAVDTGTIERALAASRDADKGVSPIVLAGACAALLHAEAQQVRRDAADPHSPWAGAGAWMLSGSRQRQLPFQDKAGALHSAELSQGRGGMALNVTGVSLPFRFSAARDGEDRFTVSLGETSRTMTALADGSVVTVFDGPEAIRLTLHSPFGSEDTAAGFEAGPVAPMPGTVLALLAKPGETYDSGAPMLILEAMKMEHTLRFPARGRILRYTCAAGDFVAEGAALAEFEASEPE